nr:gametocyte-specific factor 1-like [Chrysemys picta bellii]
MEQKNMRFPVPYVIRGPPRGRYVEEGSNTQRLAQRVLQRNFSQCSFSVSKTDLEDNYGAVVFLQFKTTQILETIEDDVDQYHSKKPYLGLQDGCETAWNHPDIAKQLATCPFNARHQVPRAEISHHISSCDDKSCIEQDIVSQSNNCHREKMSTVSMWQPSPCDEDWDKDLQEQTNSTFVWGTFNSGINNSGLSIVLEQKSNLMPGMRAPKSLPYSLSWKSSKCKGRWSPPAELVTEGQRRGCY